MIPRKRVIMGCESRGDADQPYLTRYYLFKIFGWQLYLHIFHRSDEDELHDHPWAFWSLILWRGYREETPGGRKRRYWPGAILRRDAWWAHRVELVDEKPAVTLVLAGPRVREWGFFTKKGKWQHWEDYFKEHGCSL